MGICSYNVPTELCAKFQPNRMDSLRDPRNLGCELGVGEPETQERARGPTHTRHFLERIEIPAPSGNWGRPVALFGIHRRRACLGMPTDGGR